MGEHVMNALLLASLLACTDNAGPSIVEVDAPSTVEPGGRVELRVEATDPNGDTLEVLWSKKPDECSYSKESGNFLDGLVPPQEDWALEPRGSSLVVRAPTALRTHCGIEVTVVDPEGASAQQAVYLEVFLPTPERAFDLRQIQHFPHKGRIQDADKREAVLASILDLGLSAVPELIARIDSTYDYGLALPLCFTPRHQQRHLEGEVAVLILEDLFRTRDGRTTLPEAYVDPHRDLWAEEHAARKATWRALWEQYADATTWSVDEQAFIVAGRPRSAPAL